MLEVKSSPPLVPFRRKCQNQPHVSPPVHPAIMILVCQTIKWSETLPSNTACDNSCKMLRDFAIRTQHRTCSGHASFPCAQLHRWQSSTLCCRCIASDDAKQSLMLLVSSAEAWTIIHPWFRRLSTADLYYHISCSHAVIVPISIISSTTWLPYPRQELAKSQMLRRDAYYKQETQATILVDVELSLTHRSIAYTHLQLYQGETYGKLPSQCRKSAWKWPRWC